MSEAETQGKKQNHACKEFQQAMGEGVLSVPAGQAWGPGMDP